MDKIKVTKEQYEKHKKLIMKLIDGVLFDATAGQFRSRQTSEALTKMKKLFEVAE